MGKIGNHRRNPAATNEAIAEKYLELRSVNKVAAELRISTHTVTMALRKLSVPRDGIEMRKKFKIESAREIRGKYESGLSFADLVREFGGTEYSIKKAIQYAGGNLVPICPPRKPEEEAEMIRLHRAGMSQGDIAIKLGRSQSLVSRVMRLNGVRAHTAQTATHGMWKGGKFINGAGYFYVLIDAGDPFYETMSLKNGYVLEHRIVMARHLGRPLRNSETVHHINGDKLDNRIENLQLRQGRHGKHEPMCCLDCGSQRIGPCAIRD